MPLPRIELRVRVNGRHPWFFKKMVRAPERKLPAGSAVRVHDRQGRFVGTGFYNPRTELTLRMLATELVEDVDDYLCQRLDRAADYREDLLKLPDVTSGYRLVHSEGDGVPGLVLDKLGDICVAQVFSLAIYENMEGIGERLQARYPGCRLMRLVDGEAARREGMPKEPPPPPLETEVTEHGVRYLVRPGSGHKTGFFADQRDNRRLVRRLARGRRVLDLCCHAGGFALNAALGGARSVRACDLDEAAVELARTNAARNGSRVTVDHGDAFEVLRELRPGAVDLLVLDPPKWVADRAAIEDGLRRYLDLNRLALQKLAPGGLLVSCSCSGAVSEERFLKTLREAAAQAKASARIVHLRGAGPDHPVALECPETRYLKVVVLQVR